MRIAKKKVRRVAKYNEKNTISNKKKLEEEAKFSKNRSREERQCCPYLHFFYYRRQTIQALKIVHLQYHKRLLCH